MELATLCKELNNWFDVDRKFGVFTIENKELKEDVGLKENQYYRVAGSIFNDGVYKFSTDELIQDETFEGAIWLMAIPQGIIELLNKINDWEEENEKAILSPFSSESFGGYSYSKSDFTSGKSGVKSPVNTIFGAELNRWRKV